MFFSNVWNNFCKTMGLSERTVNLSDLSDSSDSEHDSFDTGTNTNVTTDAAPRLASLPNPQAVLNLEEVIRIEQNLDPNEIISLVFLLFEDPYYALQEVTLWLMGSRKRLLYDWANIEEMHRTNWKNKLIESLCIIKNYQILKSLGYKKTDVIAHYLPDGITSLHVNRIRKAAYLVCDGLNTTKTLTFLDHARKYFQEENLKFDKYDPQYLELYFLKWESMKFITMNDLTNVKQILKIMSEEHLYNILDKVIPQNVRKVNPEGLPSKKYNEMLKSEKLASEPASSKFRKPSTSVDHQQNNTGPVLPLLSYEGPSPTTDHENTSLLSDNKYEIDIENPGIVLIINQEIFYTEVEARFQHLLPPNLSNKLESRQGSQKDKDHLNNIFNKFGFRVIIEENLTHQDMLTKIKEVVKMVQDESSLFVCILSHGARGIVYGANSCAVKVTKIQEIMCKNNKSNLANKPKVLILQSCQGQECQKIVDEISTDEDDDYMENLTTDGNSTRQNLPRTADLLTFWATVPGYAAIRNKRTGTWFIQSLCKHLEDIGNKRHFFDICTRVVNEVTGKIWHEEDKKAMTPMVVSTLTKDFYLPPRRHN